MSPPDSGGVSRRAMLRGAGAAAFAGVLGKRALAEDGEETPAKPQEAGIASQGPDAVAVAFTLNGEATTLQVEPRVTLLDALRDRLGATGSKRVCDRGACGACTVWLDGATVNACMLLAVDVAGTEVTTIEGIADDAKLAPIQDAFVRCDAMQCGFCTSGMLMSCAALLRDVKQPTLEQTRHAVVGNLCRCGTYPHVFDAVQEAAK